LNYINENNQLERGDLVKRMITSHYTNMHYSDAIGVVLSSHYPLAKVFFYDTNKEETWNQRVLERIQRESNE
jgi:hypothetical protein